MTNWLDWHLAYDDPSSPLARRLEAVRRCVDVALERTRCQEPRLLSLCAGDGRDVIPVLAKRGIAFPCPALLVEQDDDLARRATAAAATAGLVDLEVRCADASDPATFADHVPADVLLLCGIFGNVAPADVETVIAALPMLLADHGFVIWTRGASDPDMRPQIREWFVGAGWNELSFDGSPEPFGVGLNQMARPTTETPQALPNPLFTFLR
jgi:hypothetical protein